MTAPFTLDQAQVGDRLTILRLADAETAAMALRLGVAEGECVELVSKIPGGPLVLRVGAMELALGRSLCRSIEVERLPCPV
jgi:Fe2+ transport system protein FeoA